MAEPNQDKKPEQAARIYVAKIRTALSGPEAEITKKLVNPEIYANGTVKDVIDYLVDKKQLAEAEVTTARSIKEEMQKDYTIEANGRTVKPEDKVADLFEEKTHKGVQYLSLEMQIASVQEGGLEYLF